MDRFKLRELSNVLAIIFVGLFGVLFGVLSSSSRRYVSYALTFTFVESVTKLSGIILICVEGPRTLINQEIDLLRFAYNN